MRGNKTPYFGEYSQPLYEVFDFEMIIDRKLATDLIAFLDQVQESTEYHRQWRESLITRLKCELTQATQNKEQDGGG